MWPIYLLSTFMLLSSCSYFNEAETLDDTSISGIIISESTGNPVSGAVIKILQPTSSGQTTATDGNGVFSIHNLPVDNSGQLTLEISKENYITVYLEMSASPGEAMNTGIIQLREGAEAESSSISGVLYDDTSNDPVSGAQVSIIQPTSLRTSTVTDDDGLFSFGSLSIENSAQVTIEVRKEGYNTLFIESAVVPGSDISTGIVHITSQTEPDVEQTGGAAIITLTDISEQAINIKETGGITTSAITVVVQDSTGQSISPSGPVTVHFALITGTGGDEKITPESVLTDEQGTATAHLVSGNTAGVVKIEARVEREDIGLTVRSKPITVAIHGGYPDQDHFSIAADIYNFEAWSINGNRNPISVIVGDKFSNPVKPGTPVYFSTDGGIIQGSGTTSDDGQITVDLISGNPRPDDYYATVTATTKNEHDEDITIDLSVLFSGPPSAGNISVSPQTFNLAVGAGRTYSLTVTDINENPLPQGTTISVEMESDILTLGGDTNIEIPNALIGGGGVTQFNFSVRDNDDENLVPQSFDITVKVNTPGNFSAQRTFSD